MLSLIGELHWRRSFYALSGGFLRKRMIVPGSIALPTRTPATQPLDISIALRTSLTRKGDEVRAVSIGRQDPVRARQVDPGLCPRAATP